MKPPPDHLERERALAENRRNVCVLAGAGAGKTSLLVEKMLRAIIAEGRTAAGIVAITFTEKAAAQMRGRLRGALLVLRSAIASQSTEAERILEHCARIGMSLEDIRQRAAPALIDPPTVATVHAFAYGLLRRWPKEASLPPAPEIDDGTRFRRHLRISLLQHLEHGLAGEQADSLSAILERLSLPDVQSLVQSLISLPDTEETCDPESLFKEWREEMVAVREGLDRLQDALSPERATRFSAVLEAHRQLWEEIASTESPAAIHAALKRHAPRLQLEEKLPGVPRSLARTQPAGVSQALKVSRERLLDIGSIDEPFCALALECCRPIARRIATEFLEGGSITFDQLLVAAHGLLLRNHEVRRAESGRIHLLLIDEFQDTDPLQCEIAWFLCEDPTSAPAADAWQVRLQPGKLFLVGDPKQSIYRFRGADLDVYQRATLKVEGEGGLRCVLSASFRAPPSLLEPLNVLFERFFPPSGRAESGFERLCSARPEPEEEPIEIWTVVEDEEDRGSRAAGRLRRQGRRREGGAIAEQIGRWLTDGAVRPRDIAILLRSLNDLDDYVRPLRDLGVPFIVDGGRTFALRSEIDEALCLLQSAADPTDPIAFLGALRSALFALTDQEIAEFAREAQGQFTVPRALASKQAPRARAAAERLFEWHRQLASEPLGAALHSILEGSEFLTILSASRDGAQAVANVRKLALALQKKVGDTSTPFLLALTEWSRDLERTEAESESSLVDESLDAVRVLTIHKAKGLEFPIVIIPDLDRREPPHRSNGALARRLTLRDGRSFLALSSDHARNLASVLSDVREEQHRRAENRRLLYVATTRACRRLILVNHSSKASSDWSWLKALEHWTHDPLADDAPIQRLGAGSVTFRRIAQPAPKRFLGASRQPDSSTLRAAVGKLEECLTQLRAKRTLLLAPSRLQESRAPWPAAAGGARRLPGELLGSVCHRVLERWDLSVPPSPEDLAQAAAWVANDRGFDLAEIEGRVREILCPDVLKALKSHLEDVEIVAREMPVICRLGAATIRGFVDLVYRRGSRWVVADYKTDRGLERDGFQERYAASLSLYALAVRAAWKLQELPGLEVFWLRTGEIIPLEPVGPDQLESLILSLDQPRSDG